ncbi:LacI family DNA-binding transcriptional regulator [Ruania halotolerans]|uniref:LacI family DNA-binding transcriptional regulator n=1 Tax=Ruania halotolerans TaxID=2897773 RepID=UPI001E420BFA|nr:LacI family DNA-binding transcriptional regulator [Ruania halotolerans]UFU04978.1 LacI family transcriptional regulator [Ruania halotolerans]
MITDRPVRITDVAHAAGVSIATVSRVLNGSSTVDPVLAERVRAAAKATRYVPNSNGRALRRQRADVWAAIVSDVKNPFFTSLVTAVEHVAVRSGHAVMLCNTDEQLDRERGYLDAAIAQHMSGVVVSVTSEADSDLRPLLAAGIPTVVVDRRVHDFAGDSILLDNERAGRMAVEHLLARGHRDIMCLAGPSGVSTTEDRLDGMRNALADSRVPLESERMVRTDLQMADAEAAVRAALAQPRRPDAVVAMNGPLTAGAYRGIQASGLRMPEEISLVGVDDDTWTQMVHPAVTLVAQPVEEMGTRAAERLHARAADPQIEPIHLLLEPELIVRGTTASRDLNRR